MAAATNFTPQRLNITSSGGQATMRAGASPADNLPQGHSYIDLACAYLQPFSGQPMNLDLIKTIQGHVRSLLPHNATPAPQLAGRVALPEEEDCFIMTVRANLQVMKRLLQHSSPVYFPPKLVDMAYTIALHSFDRELVLPTGPAAGQAVAYLFPDATGFVFKSSLQQHDSIVEYAEVCNCFAIPSHKNIVDFCGIAPPTSENDLPRLVSEYMPEGDLFEFLRPESKNSPLPLILVRSIARGMMDALQHLHRKQILYCDMKAENVTLRRKSPDELEVKLIDFEFSLLTTSDINTPMMQRARGTPAYFPPEYFINATIEDDYPQVPVSAKADIWALGCVLFEICTLPEGDLVYYLCPGKPIKDPSLVPEYKRLLPYFVTAGLQERIQTTVIQALSVYSAAGENATWLGELINACLTVDPTQRPSIDELCRQFFPTAGA